MTKYFEYDATTLPRYEFFSMDDLNKMGRDGWELCGFQWDLVIWKRELSPEDRAESIAEKMEVKRSQWRRHLWNVHGLRVTVTNPKTAHDRTFLDCDWTP